MSNIRYQRKSYCVLMVMLAVLFLISFGSSQTIAQTKVKELKWATFVPENAYDSPMSKRFAEDVERYTNGAVKIRIYWPGQIADVKEMVELTRNGTIDMSSSAPTYYPSILPLNVSLQSFPMLFKSTEEASYVWRNLSRGIPEVQKEFTAQNQYCLNRANLSVYYTISRKPIRSSADLKGMKVRAMPGKYFSQIMESAGAVSLTTPISEVYEGLLRGALDAAMLTVQVFESLKFYEPAKYVSLPVGTLVAYWINVNLDVWNGFTPEIKNAFTRAATEWGARMQESNISTEAASIKSLKEKGVQFLEFKDWDAMIAKAGDPWVAAKDSLIKDLKVDPAVAERYVKRWHELSDEYKKNYSSTGKQWKYE